MTLELRHFLNRIRQRPEPQADSGGQQTDTGIRQPSTEDSDAAGAAFTPDVVHILAVYASTQITDPLHERVSVALAHFDTLGARHARVRKSGTSFASPARRSEVTPVTKAGRVRCRAHPPHGPKGPTTQFTPPHRWQL